MDFDWNGYLVAFGTGKSFRYLNINAISGHIGESRACALPVFHALTGYDTTSAFKGRGKKTACQAYIWGSRSHKRRSIYNIPLLKMHYFNIHGTLCTKLEFGQALRHTKCYHLLINLLGKSWEPIWITIPQVSKAYSQLIKCAWKGDCTRCKCAEADLTCSPLCNCKYNQ